MEEGFNTFLKGYIGDQLKTALLNLADWVLPDSHVGDWFNSVFPDVPTIKEVVAHSYDNLQLVRILGGALPSEEGRVPLSEIPFSYNINDSQPVEQYLANVHNGNPTYEQGFTPEHANPIIDAIGPYGLAVGHSPIGFGVIPDEPDLPAYFEYDFYTYNKDIGQYAGVSGFLDTI